MIAAPIHAKDERFAPRATAVCRLTTRAIARRHARRSVAGFGAGALGVLVRAAIKSYRRSRPLSRPAAVWPLPGCQGSKVCQQWSWGCGLSDTQAMHLPDHEFIKPSSLEEGLAVLNAQAGSSKLLAGGTDVVFNMRGQLFAPDVLLSLRDLPELQACHELADGRLYLGAGARLTDLERWPALQAHPALRKALRSVASRHIRNMATLGGNLCLDTRCWYTNQTAEWRAAKGGCLKTGVSICHAIKTSSVCVALNAADTAAPLIALDARVVLRSVEGEREMSLADFYTNDGIKHTRRRTNEILTAVVIPPSNDRMVFIKETSRKGNDFSYGVIAARRGNWRLVLGCLTSRPVVLNKPAKILAEGDLTPQTIAAAVAAVRPELGTLTNLYTPAAYKSGLAKMLVEDALLKLREG